MTTILYKLFKLKQHNTTVKTEIIAGITTFMTLGYIVFVNPNILMQAGIDKGSATIATCLIAAIATLIMALWTNYPFVIAPGLGLSTYFVSIVVGQQIPWQTALGIVCISGILFLFLNILKFRKKIVEALPNDLKNAISAGIGVYIAYIGLKQAGIIVSHGGGYVLLGNLLSVSTFLSVAGIVIASVLMTKKIRGAILISIVSITTLGLLIAFSGLKPDLIIIPHNIMKTYPTFRSSFLQMDLLSALNSNLIHIIFVFFIIDLFDTVGTVIGLGQQIGINEKNIVIERVNRVFFVDALATIIGSFFGTSASTTYMESSAGIAEGGRTGLTALTVSILFLLSIFFLPLIVVVPLYATAPALIVVGSIMLRSVNKINWKDTSVSIPSMLIILGMPITNSIADGMAFGFIMYTIINLLSGKKEKVHPFMIVITLLLITRYFIVTT